MKTIYYRAGVLIALLVAGFGATSCMSGQTAGDAGAESETVNITNTANDIHTSSDMNISPSNLTTSDPALQMQEDSLSTTPAPVGQ